MNDFTINTEEVRSMFADLSSRDRKKVFKNAIRTGLNIIKKQAVYNLKLVANINKKDRWGNTLRKGVKVKVYRDAKVGSIHILGNFKLKFFELGTLQRFNKKRNGVFLRRKRNTGRITASHFFRNARQSKERNVLENIDNLLVQSIQKINNRHR